MYNKPGCKFHQRNPFLTCTDGPDIAPAQPDAGSAAGAVHVGDGRDVGADVAVAEAASAAAVVSVAGHMLRGTPR